MDFGGMSPSLEGRVGMGACPQWFWRLNLAPAPVGEGREGERLDFWLEVQ